MIAQQLLRLVQELAFVLRTRSFITSPQLRQKFYPCPFTHRFIHSGQGNPTFGATYSFTALFTPSRVTILLAQFDVITFGASGFDFGKMASTLPTRMSVNLINSTSSDERV